MLVAFASAPSWLVFSLFELQVLFCKAAFWLFGFQAVLLHGVIPPQAQVLALPFELHGTVVSPFLHLFEVLLSVITTLWYLNRSQFSVMCEPAETALCAISQAIDEDVKHH